MKPFLRVAVACSFLTLASSARAGDATAQALFEEARALMDKGDYANACKKFEGSQSLDPAAGTQFNLALCYEKSGKTASAWATYLDAATAYKATNRPEWETKARAKATQLASTLAKVTIAAPNAPADLKVTRDGKPVLASELGSAIPLDPGSHTVEATAKDRTPFTTTFELQKNGTKIIEVVLGPLTAPSVASSPPPAREEQSSWQAPAAYVVGGVGVAGLILGGVTGLVAKGKNDTANDHCPNDGVCSNDEALRANNQAKDWATVSTVGFIAGGVLLAAGVVLWVTAPKSRSRVGLTNQLVVTF